MKGNTVLVLLLVIFLSVIVVLDNKRENFTLDELESELENNIDMVSDMVGTDASEFISKNNVAVDTAKDIIFNVKKMTDVQNTIKRNVLHNVYKLIALIFVLLLTFVLIATNSTVLEAVFNTVFGLLKKILSIFRKNTTEFGGFVNKMTETDFWKSRVFSFDNTKKFW